MKRPKKNVEEDVTQLELSLELQDLMEDENLRRMLVSQPCSYFDFSVISVYVDNVKIRFHRQAKNEIFKSSATMAMVQNDNKQIQK